MLKNEISIISIHTILSTISFKTVVHLQGIAMNLFEDLTAI